MRIDPHPRLAFAPQGGDQLGRVVLELLKNRLRAIPRVREHLPGMLSGVGVHRIEHRPKAPRVTSTLTIIAG